ncbi:elongation factor G [Babesia caballi]|uniref:Elongation factor G n=1 Tax=Babesia caballi TaxID=5871 RepID=A0AAV4M2A9_BABCB|nr:elongation factor G [Babesia caballi]
MGFSALLNAAPKLRAAAWQNAILGRRCAKRLASTSSAHTKSDYYSTNDIRNIGIVAHIDAGKTTLAEALLARAHECDSRNMAGGGNVNLDFMEQEIKRGITIRAACSSFNWKRRHVNIIDTPGHTDFSGEVFNAMCVIDGCIIVVDGTKGVQAQTRHLNAALPPRMPRILFINKIDRPGVSIDDNLQSIRKHLRLHTVLVNVPKGDARDTTPQKSIASVLETDGASCQHTEHLLDALTDCLCNIDEDVADVYLTQGSVPTSTLVEGLARHVHNGNGNAADPGALRFRLNPGRRRPAAGCRVSTVPTTRAAACTGRPCKGAESPGTLHLTQGNTLVYSFKTVHGDHSHVHAFCKVVTGGSRTPTAASTIAGALTPGMRLHNLTLGKTAQAGKVYKIHGSTYQERARIVEGNESAAQPESSPGDIAMISGMNETRTGHILSTNPKQALPNHLAAPSTAHVAAKCVCFATFTAKDDTHAARLLDAMAKLKVEDPSVYYKHDPDAVEGLVVGGYGEFHLEILAELLKDDYGIPVNIGRLRVAFKVGLRYALIDFQESPTDTVEVSLNTDATTPEDRTHIGLQLIMEPMDTTKNANCADPIKTLTTTPEPPNGSPDFIATPDANAPLCQVSASLWRHKPPQVEDAFVKLLNPNGSEITHTEAALAASKTREIIASVKQLLLNALAAGPLIGGSMIHTRLKIAKLKLLPTSTVAGAKAVASKAIKNIYSRVPIEIQQPVVSLNIVAPTEYVGNIVTDLASQHVSLQRHRAEERPKGQHNKHDKRGHRSHRHYHNSGIGANEGGARVHQVSARSHQRCDHGRAKRHDAQEMQRSR